MDKRIVLSNLGTIIEYLGVLMLIPMGVAVYYREPFLPFLFSSLITFFFGLFLEGMGDGKEEIGRLEGFAIVSLGWLLVAVFGAFPYIFSGVLDPFNAFFESMSGFTTTGSTVMIEIEKSHLGILFWRSFTQWIGGMGVILLFIAIFPKFAVAGSQLFDKEFPGPMPDKLGPRIQATARKLWMIYVLFTVIEFVILYFFCGMNSYYAICTSLSTMPTGGFSPLNKNIAGFANPAVEAVVIIFMFLAGVNFSLHYSLIIGKFKGIFKNKEFRTYCTILIVSILLVLWDLYRHGLSLYEAFRCSSFQVVSFMTTTGFTSCDFSGWSDFSKSILLILMFVGGCAGSTSGAVKVIRIFVLVKHVYREILKVLYPKGVFLIKTEEKPIPEEAIRAIISFFIVYIFVFLLCSLIMSAIGLDFISAISSVAATLGNVGPGFGIVTF
ncbi:MAG: TrkH family potassium uptake protein, partial [Candidatus Syntropharchaeia archaeon]